MGAGTKRSLAAVRQDLPPLLRNPCDTPSPGHLMDSLRLASGNSSNFALKLDENLAPTSRGARLVTLIPSREFVVRHVDIARGRIGSADRNVRQLIGRVTDGFS